MSNKCVTLVLKKAVVDDDTVLYLPYQVAEGEMGEDQIFTDATAREIAGLNLAIKDGETPEEVYLDLVKPLYYENFKGRYSNQELSDIVRGYTEQNKQTMYMVKKDKWLGEKLTPINVSEIESNLGVELRSILDEEVKDEFEKRIQDFSDWVARGTATGEQLESVSEEVRHYQEIVADLVDNLDCALGFRNIDMVFDKAKALRKEAPSAGDLYAKYGVINIPELFNKVTKTLIGQDEPARRMITEISRLSMDKDSTDAILLAGGTGTGKTLLLTLIGKYLNRPFLLVDSTQLSVPGRAGKHIEEYLWDLYEKCGRSVSKAEEAIVFFDEIDKKSTTKSDSDNRVLDVLLKFLDGVVYTASADLCNASSKNNVNISSKNMIVVCGGAFSEVFDSTSEKHVGFIEDEEKKTKTTATTKDFIKKGGMTGEFMGRNTVRIKLNDIDFTIMKRIILESDRSALFREKRRFERLDVKLTATDEYINGVATRALKLNTGARAISGIILDSTWAAYDDVVSNLGKYSEIVIGEETLDNPKSYIKKEK